MHVKLQPIVLAMLVVIVVIMFTPGCSVALAESPSSEAPSTSSAALAETVERVSISSAGVQGNGESLTAVLSENGRYAAFQSDASNLVSNDTNNRADIFVFNRQSRTIERVSVSTGGNQANGTSLNNVAISENGRYVAFSSEASNLVSNDTNGARDVFVHDRTLNTLERVSIASNGSQGNGDSIAPWLSADGNKVVFSSEASNLATGDANGATDVFVHDRSADTTTLVSVSSSGVQGNGRSSGVSISANGSYVVFDSHATNLVSGDNNQFADSFVRDLNTGTTEIVSIASDGTQGNANSGVSVISEDGQFVVFTSDANSLVSDDTNGKKDVFVHDRHSGLTRRISVSTNGAQANDDSRSPEFSHDGRTIVFMSHASNLVQGDTNGVADIFVHSYDGATTRVSQNSAGVQGNATSWWEPAVSPDGECVAFISDASNLVSNDTNNARDAFVSCGYWPVPPEDPTLYPLSITVQGNGQVSRSPNATEYQEGTNVTLTATADSDYRFVGWSGDVSSTSNPLVVNINSATSIIAEFEEILVETYTLEIQVFPADGSGGTVTINPDLTSYAEGTQVTLTAVPNPGYDFIGWTGLVTSSDTVVTVNMPGQNSVVLASFVESEYDESFVFLPLTSYNIYVPPTFPILVNGNFDNSSGSGWQQETDSPKIDHELIVNADEIPNVSAVSSPNVAWLGGTNMTTDRLLQSIDLPTEYSNLQLSYRYLIRSLEPSHQCGDDLFRLRVYQTGTEQYEQLQRIGLCDDTHSDDWQSATIPINQFAGSDVEIHFIATNDGDLESSIFFDDVAICDDSSEHPCE